MLLAAQPQTHPDFAEEFEHLYYGNIYGPGQVVIAATGGAFSRAEACAANYKLGSADRDSYRWHNLPAGLATEAVFTVGNGAVVTTLHKWPGGDGRGSYYYHWVFLSRRRTTDLWGAWDLVFAALAAAEPKNLYEAYPRPNQKADYFRLRFTAQQIQQSAEKHTQRFFHEFPRPEDRRTAAQIISLCLRGGDACVITGIKTLPERLKAALSVAALLPPPLRVLASFATGVRHVDGCAAAIKFIDADQTSGSDYVVNWSAEAKTFTGYREPPKDLHPLAERLLRAADDGPGALQRLHDKWSERGAALMAHHDDAQRALAMLMRWIDLDERWDSGRDLAVFAELAALLVDDDSVEMQRRQALWRQIITQAAGDPESPHIAEIGKALSAHFHKQPILLPNDVLRDALFSAARRSDGLGAYHLTIRLLAEGYLPRSSWQDMPLKLALEHLRALTQPNDVIKALLAFERSKWDHSADWLQLLGDGLNAVSGQNVFLSEDDALQLFELCLAHLSPMEIAELLTAKVRWLSQLPQELAKALSGWPKLSANILEVMRRHLSEEDAERALRSFLQALHPLSDVTWLVSSWAVNLLIQASMNRPPMDDEKTELNSSVSLGAAADAALREMVMQGASLKGEEAYKVRFELLVWGLQRTASLRENPEWSAALSKLLETLLPDEPQRLPELFRKLLDKGAPLRALFNAAGAELRRWVALLHASDPSMWSQVPDLPRSLIQALVSGQEADLIKAIGTDRSLELLRWQVSKDPDVTDTLTSGLLKWWIDFLRKEIELGDTKRSALRLDRVVSALQDVEGALRFYEDSLFNALRDVQIEHLEGLRAAVADLPRLRRTQLLLNRLILIKRLLPDGSFDTFIRELQGAKALLLRLQALPLEIDQSAKMESILSDELAAIPKRQVEALHEALDGFSELLYQLAKDYEAQDRRISGPLGLGSSIKLNLEEGRAAPKSRLGMLRWLQGVAARSIKGKRP
jgi:hypothetical protein